VLVRQLVHLKAQVVDTGSTSIRVFVLVETVGPKTRLPHKTNHCIITFVAMSEAVELVSVTHWE
jgi:acyl-CoA hydrolase